MPISSEELTRRLAEADRRRVALRKATRELTELGRQIRKERSKLNRNVSDRPKRSSRSSTGRD